MIKLQQYNVFKLNTSRIAEGNYNLTLDITQARLNGELVQIGDNQVFRMIRIINESDVDVKYMSDLMKKRNSLKYLPTCDDNKLKLNLLQKEIDNLNFVKEIINVKVDDRKVYKILCKQGFIVNGTKYIRFCSGAGQSRRNTASFVSEYLYEELTKRLHCGINFKSLEINIAKYNAYFGLYLSATYPVRTPRVCLINDCEDYTMRKTVDWIKDDEVTEDGKKSIKRTIQEKEIDFTPNMFDGQGLVSPSFAQKWQEDLELDYLPSQFGIRSSFIKGMLSVFDFQKFATDVAKTNKITDVYGQEWDASEIDVILSVSQFKMWKYYSSWETFRQLQDHFRHSWGVTKVNHKEDKEMSLLNYQYIQTLDLTKEDLSQLSSYTINWIEKICSGDKLNTLLFLLGHSDEDVKIDKIFNKTNSNFVKAILYNDELLNDPYIKKKIYDSIATKIKAAKIGRLWVNGNYQCMVSDPYAQAQFAFGLPVTGLLEEFQHYSNFWNNRGITKVDACRSPMVDFHEHNVLNFLKTEQTEEWYKYNKSGILYNVWGVDTIRHSDSDWDYDIVFTTDNEIVLKGIRPNQNVITYDKSTAKAEKLNKANIMKTDLRSFNCKVGSITNYSTTFITMLNNFKKDTDEYKELTTRIKLLRRYIGDSIDAAKGIKTIPFPSEWKTEKYVKYNEDAPETIKEKRNYNNMVASKKPYFMIYIYDKLHEKYKIYRKENEQYCKKVYGCTLNQLVRKKNKTQEESMFIYKYYKKMPVVKNQSTMNTLCNMVENVDFKFKHPNLTSNHTYKYLINTDITIDKDKLKLLEELYKKFKRTRNFNLKNNSLEMTNDIILDENTVDNTLDNFYEQMRNDSLEICSNITELATYLVHICYVLYPDSPKDFAWIVGIEGIMENIRNNSLIDVEVPVLDNGGTEYLGKNYSLRRVSV